MPAARTWTPFTTGIRQDYQAVRNGLTLPWSSGLAEGLNTRTELLKRQMYGANIRVLRQRKGWSQAQVAELMGWPSNSTVCAAEGRRGSRRRGFTAEEVERLADIFGVPARQLTTRCANCEGNPPAGFAWPAEPDAGRPGRPVRPVPGQDGDDVRRRVSQLAES